MTISKVIKVIIIWILFLASGFLYSNFNVFASESDTEILCSSIPFEKAAVILSLPENDLQKSHRELMYLQRNLQFAVYLTR